MHEFSIGERIVAAVLEELSRVQPAPERLCKTRVVIGGLHQIVPEYLVNAYSVLTRDTDAGGSEIELVFTPVVGRCRRCDWEGTIELPVFRCAGCGAFEIDVVGGRELYLEHLEVEPAAV